jgi:hypothetical protein
MEILDSDGGGTISKKEFTEILDNVDAVRCLHDVGVDVFALVDLADYIFADDDADNQDEIELDFTKFMEVILQLRGTNAATVKDIVDLRKFMRQSLYETYRQTTKIIERLDDGFRMHHDEITAFKKHRIDIAYHTQNSMPKANHHSEPQKSHNVQDAPPMGGHNAPVKSGDSLLDLQPHYHPNLENHPPVEGGTPPSLPQPTPSTHLLSSIPMAVDVATMAPAAALEPKLDMNADKNAHRTPLVGTQYPRTGAASHSHARIGESSEAESHNLALGKATSAPHSTNSAEEIANLVRLHIDRRCGELEDRLNNAITSSLARQRHGDGQ